MLSRKWPSFRRTARRTEEAQARRALALLSAVVFAVAGFVGCSSDAELLTQQFQRDAEHRRARAAAPSATLTSTIVPSTVTPSPTRTPRPGRTLAVVRRVWDGQTILIDSGYSVRYIGVEAPGAGMFGRPVEPFGREAAARNVELVEGKEVELEAEGSDVNASGLLLRHVFVDDVLVSEVLLQDGLASLGPLDRNSRYAVALRDAEQRARQTPLNIWTLVTPTPTITPTPSDTPTPTLSPTPFGVPIVITPRLLPTAVRPAQPPVIPTQIARTPTPLPRPPTPLR